MNENRSPFNINNGECWQLLYLQKLLLNKNRLNQKVLINFEWFMKLCEKLFRDRLQDLKENIILSYMSLKNVQLVSFGVFFCILLIIATNWLKVIHMLFIVINVKWNWSCFYQFINLKPWYFYNFTRFIYLSTYKFNKIISINWYFLSKNE